MSLIMLSLIKIKYIHQSEDTLMFMLLSEQAFLRPTLTMQATWCLRATCWWFLLYIFLLDMVFM